MTEMRYPFNPILGSEEKVLAQSSRTGNVYFTTDTRKIYFDIDENQSKIPMGGNIGLFYGNMQLSSPPTDGQEDFDFSILDIIENKTENKRLQPNPDDLILNSDGCFYKVLSSSGRDENVILHTKKLTIAGTGGSGSGPSTPGSLASFTASRLQLKYQSVLFGKSCPVSFAVKVTDDLGDLVGGNVATYTLYINGVEKDSGKVKGITSGDINNLDSINLDEITTIDVGPFLRLGNDNEVKVHIKGRDGGSSTRAVNVATTDMKLTWNYDETTLNRWITSGPDAQDEMLLEWTVSGVNLLKTTYIVINEDEGNPIKIAESTHNNFSFKLKFSEYNLFHGAHSIKMWAEAEVGGVPTATDPVYKNIVIAKDNDASTIISISLFTRKLTQYNTIKIPIFIYSATNITGNAVIQLIENGVNKDTWENISNLEVRDWAYTPTVAGDNIILTVQSGGREKSITISVDAIDIDIHEKENYAFKFKATDFSSNESIQNWNSNGCTVSFSEKFDWINGGLKTEEDGEGGHRQYVAIKAGSEMSINYDLFNKNPSGYGKHLKIIFKATNCRDYDANVMQAKTNRKIIFTDMAVEYYLLTEAVTQLSYSADVGIENDTVILLNPTSANLDITNEESRNLFQNKFVQFNDGIYRCSFAETEKGSNVWYAIWYKTIIKDSFWGLVLNAQNATFNSNNASVTTQYCEDSYIEFELEITKKATGKPYIKFWIDGVPSNYVRYSDSDRFVGADKLTIGSSECDVYIYLIKLYESDLDVEEHMDNFYADAPNAEEMIRRYRRNDIMDDNRDGEIDPLKLAVANPDCLVHIYDIPHIPTTKKDLTYPCSYEQYQGSSIAKLHADGVMIKVQGTSSEKYVVAAANLDTDFNFTDDGNIPTGLIDTASGEKLEGGWSMDGGTAIPVDFFCTKVNVASCENANNAMNQEWYNMFQPYKSVLRCKNPRARDTMQFTNGVLFMIDRNTTFNTEASADKKYNNVFGEKSGYIANPYAKMYSLGQMGNSKDNIHVFHDVTNPKECCIEVRDNQTPQQWMVSYDYNHADIGEKEKYFEFRYPEGVDNASQEMIDGWNRLVKWFAESNPSPKYNKFENITTEDAYKQFAINKKTLQTVDVYVMNEDETAYEKVDGFDPTISTYYTETEHVHGYTNLKLQTPLIIEEAYTFNGFVAEDEKDENGELWQKDYTPVIKGFTTNKYVGEYAKDTYEYRMAKMLYECEDYLIMDSVLFHFLFIERHCMVDNVAKNTFWSTEDCKHWSLIKDYDNDTSDGNDNNGKFTRTYGMEPLDKLNQNAYVFNAHQSVWFNFINGLKEVCDAMYQRLETRKVKYQGRDLSVWDAQGYLWLFDKWQKIIPERCWIEDYYRKYFRPSELYNDDMFVEMMEGGQKKYQRKQYETYEDIYMSSKYDGSSYLQSEIKFRPTGSNVKGLKLPVKVYSDCYVRMDLGSDSSKERVKRNTTAYVECPTNNLNNATMYLFPSKVFTSIGDINGGQVGHFAPDQGSFSGASKLRELIFATKDNVVKNQGLTGGLNFSANPLLEKLYIANLLAYENDLNLSECPSLIELDASNSAFTGITIADGAPVTSITLNAPSSLNLSNLNELEQLIIDNYNRLNTLKLNNIDNEYISTKSIVETALDKLAVTGDSLEYLLTNVKWTIDNSDAISDNRIVLLETLLDTSKAQPAYQPDNKNRYPYSAALTGILNLTSNAYNGSSEEALEMHDNYINKNYFANMNLNFDSSNSLLYNVIIYNGDGIPVWKRKAIPNDIIDEDFLLNGPEGSFKSSSLEKSPTAEFEYEFLNKWTVKDDNGTIIQTIESAEPTGAIIAKNLHLYPEFKTTNRSYLITVKSKHPETGNVQVLLEQSFVFGTSLNTILNEIVEIPYADSSNLSLYQSYDFIGYSLVENSNTIISNQFSVNGKATLWAVFNLVDDIRTIVHPEWFIAEQYRYNETLDTEYYGTEGVSIRPKYSKLKGKITLPATMLYNGEEKPVIAIQGFAAPEDNRESQSNYEITHVFMETNKENHLYMIMSSAFRGCKQLVYFDFDNCAVRTIGDSAFKYDSNLTNTSFGTQLFRVRSYAFNQSLTSKNPVTVRWPASLSKIEEFGFGILGFKEGSTLEIGSENNLSILQLQANVNIFQQNDGNKFATINFYSQHHIAGELLVEDIFNQGLTKDGTLTIYGG